MRYIAKDCDGEFYIGRTDEKISVGDKIECTRTFYKDYPQSSRSITKPGIVVEIKEPIPDSDDYDDFG